MRRWSHPVAWAAAALLAAPLTAQQQPDARIPLGTITGTVYDSLSGEPLVDARIWVEGSTGSATASRRGRFRLDSVPTGTRRLVFAHPDLDSIGFPQFGRRVVVAAGEQEIDLAVPSLATIARSVCGNPLAPERRGGEPLGIVFGAVREAGSETRLAGARVEISWLMVQFERGRIIDLGRSALNVRSDSLGNYYTCGVPTQRMVAVAAGTAASASGRLDVLVGERRIRRQDLTIAIDTLAMMLDSTGSLTGRAVVAGTVRTTTGAPLAGAQALVDDAGEPVTTDQSGRFLLVGQPAGTHMLTVRAIGYGALRTAVHLATGDTVRITASLQQLTVLDTLTVTAPRSAILGEVVQRLRGGGWGHVLVGEQVRRAAMMTTVIQQLPSIQVRDNGRDLMLVGRVGGRECLAHVWVNGFRSDMEQLRAVRPREVVAVEWYPRGSFVPLRYQPGSLDHCGVLLVWTDALR